MSGRELAELCVGFWIALKREKEDGETGERNRQFLRLRLTHPRQLAWCLARSVQARYP